MKSGPNLYSPSVIFLFSSWYLVIKMIQWANGRTERKIQIDWGTDSIRYQGCNTERNSPVWRVNYLQNEDRLRSWRPSSTLGIHIHRQGFLGVRVSCDVKGGKNTWSVIASIYQQSGRTECVSSVCKGQGSSNSKPDPHPTRGSTVSLDGPQRGERRERETFFSFPHCKPLNSLWGAPPSPTKATEMCLLSALPFKLPHGKEAAFGFGFSQWSIFKS